MFSFHNSEAMAYVRENNEDKHGNMFLNLL